ncbi:MAG TPA: c-type cytochrome [Geminicoccaceae bacterium]|nr:c-type cytochrome [Geminicoccaceae bacterium]
MGRAATIVLPLAAALALLSDAALAQNEVSPDEARLAFNNHCRTCHVTKEGDNRLGPSLHNIVGREAGSAPGFGYSPAMQNADFAWDEERLDRFIENPEAVVPGNNMKPFSGIAAAEERAKIVAHLKAESDGQ